MIAVFQRVLGATMDMMKIEFVLYDYTLSLWQIFLWLFIAGIILSFVGGFFNHD